MARSNEPAPAFQIGAAQQVRHLEDSRAARSFAISPIRRLAGLMAVRICRHLCLRPVGLIRLRAQAMVGEVIVAAAWWYRTLRARL
jgi:hypothetical protein